MLSPIKYLTYTVKLYGKTLLFSEPAKYSADFPRPFTQSHNINIYDPDIYPDSGYVCSIHKAYWDYGKRFSFSKVQGTLSFSILLIRINNACINLMERNSFLDETRNHFRELYTDQELEDFGITPPEKYSYLTIKELQWAYYEYLVNDEVTIQPKIEEIT